MGVKCFGAWDVVWRCWVGTIQLVCGCEVVLLSRGTCVGLRLCVCVCARVDSALFIVCSHVLVAPLVFSSHPVKSQQMLKW